jgi:hypothetical protein
VRLNESVVKLLRRGLGEEGTQLVRRGGVVDTALAGAVHVAAPSAQTNRAGGDEPAIEGNG